MTNQAPHQQETRYLLTFLALVALTPCLGAQVIDPQNIVIENVYIATPDAEDVPVNLLIRDNKLELLSEDKIPKESKGRLRYLEAEEEEDPS